jgi:hypothetical protein
MNAGPRFPKEIEIMNDETILKVEGLRKFFPIRRGVLSSVVGQVRAVTVPTSRSGRGALGL